MAHDPEKLAKDFARHLLALESMEAEIMEAAEDYGQGPANSMRGAYHAVKQVHAFAERAARQVPEIEEALIEAQLFPGSK